MPERRLYDVECIEALYARCTYLEDIIIDASVQDYSYDIIAILNREVALIRELRDGKE